MAKRLAVLILSGMLVIVAAGVGTLLAFILWVAYQHFIGANPFL